MILGFSPRGWGSPPPVPKEQRKYPFKVALQCRYGHTAMGRIFANPHVDKQADQSEQDCLSYPWTFSLVSGLNYFYVYVSVCSLLSASVSSAAASGLHLQHPVAWHKEGSLGDWFDMICYSPRTFYLNNFYQRCGLYQLRVTNMTKQSSALITGGSWSHNTSWLPSGELLHDFNLVHQEGNHSEHTGGVRKGLPQKHKDWSQVRNPSSIH